MITRVAIIGCGVVGATIAYELSRIPGMQITVFDRQLPARAATGAALGILMGAISHKVKGTAWNLRQTSLERYDTLIPELEAITDQRIPVNRQGIVMLCVAGETVADWDDLITLRREQGWHLEPWNEQQVRMRCPQINSERITGAIYSPSDRQIDPTLLTLALVDAAGRNGVTFRFDTDVDRLDIENHAPAPSHCYHVQTATGLLPVDWVVIAAGLGTTALLKGVRQSVDIRPVLGQAMRVKLPEPLGDRQFQPVITGDDIHLVPLGDGEYWIGATVEFPTEQDAIAADATQLEEVWQGAIALCPALAQAQIQQTWSGLRPRPHNRPAPIIERLEGHDNILLATGHYRNGILLAPATAIAIRDLLK